MGSVRFFSVMSRSLHVLLQEGDDSISLTHACSGGLNRRTFKYFGLQTIVENVVRSQEIKVFTRTMRQLVCQMDMWDGLTMDDIRRMEDEAKAKLDEMIKSAEKKEM